MGTQKTAMSAGALMFGCVLVFQGCMRDAVEVGSDPGAAGEPETGGTGTSGGTPGAGGSSGRGGGAGRNATGGSSTGGSSIGGSATGGSATGGSSVGGSATGGSGARGGRGGGPAGAGRGGSGGAGGVVSQAGTGGDAGAAPFAFDPACSCEAMPDSGFFCTMNLADAATRLVADSTSCNDNDNDYVDRANCSGAIVYRWSVGSENLYELDFALGTLTYMFADGYVGYLCGIEDQDYQYGVIRAGTALPSECDSQCSVCEGGLAGATGAPDLPACEPCSDRTNYETNSESIEDFCTFHHCPASLADAKSELAAQCLGTEASYNDSVVTTGCGTIGVIRSIGEGMNAYYFDAQTGALTGAQADDDTPWGNCQTFQYVGGTVPAPTGCADATTCTLCMPPAAPEASGGMGGMSAGQTLPPPCSN